MRENNAQDNALPGSKSCNFTTKPIVHVGKREVCTGRRLTEAASVVLIGPRGSGKSSLSVISAAMLGYQVIDDDEFFLRFTGMSKHNYRKTYGREAYRSRELESMEAMLVQHKTNFVIACGQGAIAAKGAALLQDYMQTHAVIYVTREFDNIAKYLGVGRFEDSKNFIGRAHTAWRQSSNYEFFNLSEQWGEPTTSAAEARLQRILPNRAFRRRSMQTLQNTTSLLARFLSVVLGNASGNLSETTFRTLIPPQPEARPFSQVLCLPLRLLQDGSVNVVNIDPCADAIELVINLFEYGGTHFRPHGSVEWAMAVLRRHFGVPIVFHVELEARSANESRIVDWKSYSELLHIGLRLGSEYLTVDLRADDKCIRHLVAAKHHSKIIGNLHMAEPCQNQWRSRVPVQHYQKGRDLGCDIIRLSQACLEIQDNFDCQRFRADIQAAPGNIPIIAFNTKPLGLLSRAFNPFLTPITHSSVLEPSHQSQKSTGPSECTADLRRLLFSLNVMHPLEFFVFGKDVESSLSPAMHNAGFEAGGMPHSYRAYQTTTLETVKSVILSNQFGGASISMPFKTEVTSMVQQLSPAARLIGAANTLLPVRYDVNSNALDLDKRSKQQRNKAGSVVSLLGDNTDWMGIHACIVRYTSPANSITERTCALALGAGGMSRAGIYTLVRLGVRNIFIFNRTVGKAKALAAEYKNADWNFNEGDDIHSEARIGCDVQNLRINVLESMDEKWPPGFDYPSIILSTIPTHRSTKSPVVNLKLPDEWLQNRTGGVVVEVCTCLCVLL
jgi:shikimate 5-dehydrogenase/shikimate kinase